MRTMVLGMVDVIMRVPPLFVIDEILKISMGLPTTNIIDVAAGISPDGLGSMNTGSAASVVINATDHLQLDPNAEFYKVFSLTTLKILTCLIGEWWTGSRTVHGYSVIYYHRVCLCVLVMCRIANRNNHNNSRTVLRSKNPAASILYLHYNNYKLRNYSSVVCLSS